MLDVRGAVRIWSAYPTSTHHSIGSNTNHMIKKSLITVAALAALIAPLAANAGEVHNRIQDQNQRINQGVKNGSLTYGEYHRLDASNDRIQAQRNRDLKANDGKLTAREAAQLNREQNRLSDRIYFDKHNRRDQRGH